MRKDAENNRLRLIEAASLLMQERGADVPMEMIARRAGLTRGTLYRNFDDRNAMYSAVLEHNLEELRQRIAKEEKDPLAFIRRLTEMMVSYDRFMVSLSQFDREFVAANHARIVEVVEAPLLFAKQRKLLRPDITSDDVVVACRMLASHWRLDGAEDPMAVLDRRLPLLIRGIGM